MSTADGLRAPASGVPTDGGTGHDLRFEVAADLDTWQRSVEANSPGLGRIMGPGGDDAFTARFFRQHFARIHIDGVEVVAPGHVVERTEQHERRDRSGYFMAIQQLSGSCEVTSGDRQLLLPAGDLTILSPETPFTLEYEGDISCILVRFPPEILGLPAAELAKLSGSWLARQSPTGILLTEVFRSAALNIAAFSGTGGRMLAHNVVDMLRTTIIEHVGGRTRSLEQPFTRVVAYIDERLGDPDLSVQAVADAHFISSRTLHGMFKAHGTTVGSWIQARRLELAARDLCDPLLRARPIGEIAEARGFHSSSHFSSSFRSYFGASPRQWRADVFGESIEAATA